MEARWRDTLRKELAAAWIMGDWGGLLWALAIAAGIVLLIAVALIGIIAVRPNFVAPCGARPDETRVLILCKPAPEPAQGQSG